MANLDLIISTDYEIFGNGSGSVDACMIAPSNKLMDLAEKFGARICFFVDVCEYWAFEQAFQAGELEANEAEKIGHQLKDAIERGHDVQLHFHPQWLDAKYENGEWKLNDEYWRLPKVEEHLNWTVYSLFERGKNTLEEMLQPVNPNYKCDVFRAGAWCIQPEDQVLEAMNELGFKIDSTVAPGMKYTDGRTMYDFTAAPKKAFWGIGEWVTKENENATIKEYPIFTTKVPSNKNIKFTRLKVSRKIPMKPDGCERKSDTQYKKSKLQKALELLKPQMKMLNHSDGCSFEEMQYITNQAIKRYQHIDGNLPLVMIGHPKTFGNHKEFERYLNWVKEHPQINFSNY